VKRKLLSPKAVGFWATVLERRRHKDNFRLHTPILPQKRRGGNGSVKTDFSGGSSDYLFPRQLADDFRGRFAGGLGALVSMSPGWEK
jgi:hypothetical protein